MYLGTNEGHGVATDNAARGLGKKYHFDLPKVLHKTVHDEYLPMRRY